MSSLSAVGGEPSGVLGPEFGLPYVGFLGLVGLGLASPLLKGLKGGF